MNVREIQTTLIALGYSPGAVDGVMGPKTRAAVRSFQASQGLDVDGVVGPVTRRALLDAINRRNPTPPPVSTEYTPWMDTLLAKKGWHERNHYSKLKEWLRTGVSYIDPIEGPWCGDAAETAISETLPNEPIPENPLASINWLKFGYPCDPQYGCVLVFWRGKPSNWQGHVGFYYGETPDGRYYLVLGGNQSNAITITKIAKERLRPNGARWPKTALNPKGGRVVSDMDVVVTTNEA